MKSVLKDIRAWGFIGGGGRRCLYEEVKNKTTTSESFGFPSSSKKEITAVYYLGRSCGRADAEVCFP